MSKNSFRYRDEQGREAEVKVAAHDPTAIAAFREFMVAIQEVQQQQWSNQMHSIALSKTQAPQSALAQSQPLQLAPSQSAPSAASFPKHPEPIPRPNPYEYADLEVDHQPQAGSQPYSIQEATYQRQPQAGSQPYSIQEATYQQPAADPTLQNPYQFEPLDDSEMEMIFDRPWWLKLLINPLSLSLSLSLLLGGAAWFAIDALKSATLPKPTPAPSVQVSPSPTPTTPVAPASPQPSPTPKASPKTGNQLQAPPSAPPPPPNS